jgi:2-polyprenyl-3-methyl-5-hydroxy-6-metoxy-1,4-benzoquinol methylase
VSWYRPHLDTSLALIDVGGGESTLADDLLSHGYQNITVLDISETAINVCKKRMEARADRFGWLPTSRSHNWIHAPTISGTTVPYFTF